MTGINFKAKRRAGTILMAIAMMAFGKTASAQCESTFTYNSFPQGCGEQIAFMVATNPPADSIVFDYGNGQTFTTNGISGESFYNGGLYEVEVTAYHTNGCVSSSSQWLNIGGLQVSIEEDTVVCQSDFTFTPIITGGSGNYYFSWWPETGLDDPNIQYPTLLENVYEETYYLNVVDPVNGCQVNDTIIVTRNAPIIDTMNLCDGPVIIDLGPGAVEYHWLSFTDTAGNNTPLTYPTTVQSITANEPGEYFAYAVFPDCGALTSLITVEGCEETCENLFTYNIGNGFCAFDEFEFFSTGTPNIIQWHWDFGDGSTSTDPNPEHVFPPGSHIVTLTTEHDGGCTDTTYQWITSNGGFTVIALSDTTACQGPAFVDAQVYGGTGNYSYEWSPTVGLADPTAQVTQAEGVHNQTYYVEVTDLGTGCVATDSLTVSSYQALYETYQLCNDSVLLDMGPGGDFYNWLPLYDDDYETQAIWTDDTGTFYVYATYPGCGAITHVFNIEECSGTCSSSFVYSLDAPVCGGWAEFIANTSSPTDSITFDFGNGAVITTTDNDVEYFMLPGVYNVTMVAYHSNGCVSDHGELITVGGGLIAEITADSVACGGNNYNFGVIVSGGSGNYAYQWFSSTSSFSDPTVQNPIHYAITEPTEIAVYVTDAVSGCQVADTTWMFPNIAINETLELCQGSILLDVPAGSDMYDWTFEDPVGNIEFMTEYDGENIATAYGIGTYTCMTYTSGCDQVIHTFVVTDCNGGCQSYFTYNPLPTGCGSTLHFVAGYTPNIDSLFYDFGDGTSEVMYNGNLVQHYYPNGIYVVNMVAFHDNGCVSEDIQTIVIDEGIEVEIFNDSMACGGDIILGAAVNGSSNGYMYQWFADGLPFAGSTQSNPILSAISDAVEISVFVSDSANNCTASDTTIIYPNLPVNDTLELCGNQLWLQAPANSEMYTWSFEDPQGNLQTLPSNWYIQEATEIGTYTCLTYTQGCLTVFHQFVVVECDNGCFAQITSDLEYDGCGAWIDLEIDLTSSVDSVVWDLGNGQVIVDEGQGPEIYYPSGSYIVFATAHFSNGCMYTTSYGITLLTEVIAEIWEDTIACNGLLPLGVNVTGGSAQYEFEWEPGSMMNNPSDQYPLMTVQSSTMVTVTVVDTYTGCTVQDSVMVYANEPLNEVYELCTDSVTLTVDPGSMIYQWIYTDQGGNTTQLTDIDNSITVGGLGTYSCFSYFSGCNTITHLFTLVECAGSNDDVWPGDANSDNIVTNADALWLGLAFGQTGPVRPNASLNWVGQPADDWVFNFSYNNVNLKHADCDGNGIINFDDTLAIDQNYGLTHNKAEMELAGGEPEIWIDAAPDTTGLEQGVHISVYMAKADLIVDSIHGLAFSLVWDESLTMVDDVELNYDQSIFGTPGVDQLTFNKKIPNEGRMDIAMSRIDGVNIDGHGLLCQLRIVTIDNLSGIAHLPIGIEGLTAITSSEDSIGFVLTSDVVVIDPENTSVSEIPSDRPIQVYPNPSNGTVYILNDGNLAQLDVMDSRGRMVLSTNIQANGRLEMDLSALENGVYHLRMSSEGAVRYAKLKLLN